MNPTTDVLLTAAGLQPGERLRIHCPACGGGAKKEQSMLLSVSETGEVRWYCFRASCSTAGSSGGQRIVKTGTSRRQQAVRPFRGDLLRLTQEQESELESLIGWTEFHLQVARPLWAPEKGRYAFPIFDGMGARRGYVLRSYDPLVQPKALTRMDRSEPHMSWYVQAGRRPTIIVEDIPSAVRATPYCNAVALAGTGCSAEYANEISAHAQDVIWALDADATSLALRLHNKHSMLFDSSRVQVLEKDIKNMDEDELQQFMQEHILSR